MQGTIGFQTNKEQEMSTITFVDTVFHFTNSPPRPNQGVYVLSKGKRTDPQMQGLCQNLKANLILYPVRTYLSGYQQAKSCSAGDVYIHMEGFV